MTAREVEPLTEPPDATVVVPGSKSITNRALVLAALADGRSVLRGAGFSDDSAAMAESLARLGVVVRADAAAATFAVDGGGGRIDPGPRELDVGLSGTTARFLAPVTALGRGRYHLDGGEPMRRRPMGPTFDALRELGAAVQEHGRPGCLPATVVADGLRGGTARIPGHLSSQFPSGLLLIGPLLEGGLRVELTSPLVSRPYLDITGAVLADFGAHLERPAEGAFAVARTGLTAGDVRIEPDASAASYFFAAAAICGGRVRVEGLGRGSVQGDLAFVDVLSAMGAEVRREDEATEVVGPGALEGGEFDLADQPDMALTLAVTAVFATSPTRVTGVGFIRSHESDRIAAVVTELRRCGIEADEEPDGFVVHPGRPRPATVHTYDDHRMAMSFALLGLRCRGIAIADPGCVAKTFPGYFEALEGLRSADTLSDP